MKRNLTALLFTAAALCLLAGNAKAVGKTTLTAYGTYWDQKTDPAYGAGLRLSKSLIDILYVDARGGYVKTDDTQTEMIPLEASLNIGLPGMITPYAGLGAGYYFVDSKVADDVGGYFAQLGVEFIFTKIGALAELRYLDLEGSQFDGVALNVGVLWKF